MPTEIEKEGAVPSESPKTTPFDTFTTRDEVHDMVGQVKQEFIADLKTKTEEFTRRIEEKETKTTEILAIFITLFTFISVNINIFTRVDDVYTAVWFMLIMTVCSIIILSFLFMLIQQKKGLQPLIFLFVALFLLGLIISSMPSKWQPKLNEIQTLQAR